jgi:hypothetical protein
MGRTGNYVVVKNEKKNYEGNCKGEFVLCSAAVQQHITSSRG